MFLIDHVFYDEIQLIFGYLMSHQIENKIWIKSNWQKSWDASTIGITLLMLLVEFIQ